MNLRGIIIRLVLLAGILAPMTAAADVILFYNGDMRYGNVMVQNATSVEMNIKGATETFLKKTIRGIYPNVNKPAQGQVASSTDGVFVHKPSGKIYSVTGFDTVRRKMVTKEGREYMLDVENEFNIPRFQLVPAQYSFYNRQGAYLTGIVSNLTDRYWFSTEFRVTFFDRNDKQIAAKDFYVFRLPQYGQRTFALALPDVPFESIDRIRIVRKF